MSKDTDEPAPDVPVPPPDADEIDWLRVHPDEVAYGSPTYQVTRELDSENGPPPRRGGPTS
jgi:hypothetical protein